VLLHLVFYAKIGSEKGSFDIADVINSLNEKLIFRHPHIYGDTEVKDEEEVKQNWEKLKLKEGNKSILGGVPKSLPSLVKAYRIQDKVKGIGFEFHDAEDAWKNVDEEIQEFHAETDLIKKSRNWGCLFLINQLCQNFGINPDSALERTNLNSFQGFRKWKI
jgi:XTP/dITP diphosphohydrolase